jgi:hypothetical protein
MSHPDTGNPTVDLRDRVDQLTLPHTVEVRDAGRLLGTRTQPALLLQLRRAITASIGPGNGTKALHERSVHNARRLRAVRHHRTRVRQWAIRASVTPNGHDAVTVLRHWYAAVYASRDLEPQTYAHTLAGWIDAITDLLDPPHRYPLNAPCPICGNTWATTDQGDPDHEERSHALQVLERDPAHLSSVTCKNCGATWHGIEGAEALSALLHTGTMQQVDA